MKYFKLDEDNNPVPCNAIEWIADRNMYDLCSFSHDTFVVNTRFIGVEPANKKMFRTVGQKNGKGFINDYLTYEEAISQHYKMVDEFRNENL